MNALMLAAVPAAALVAGLAYKARALTVSGAAAATVVGAAAFGLGGGLGAGALLVFFVTSSALSRWRRREKEALQFEKGGRRDAGQVLANGGVAAAALLIGLIVPGGAHGANLAFLAALAAANADTWATEIGAAIGGTPVSLRDFRPAPPGTSGAVSAAGTLAALAGALLPALFAPTRDILLVTLAGFAGSLIDTLLGATLQAQWRDPQNPARWTERRPGAAAPDRGLLAVNNDWVNFLCTLAAALIAILFAR
ncbi:hypothetical protein CCAX7_21110 [Capsulimonas corticalis]|uniref:Uncharacterized protein n=1 Tax=Capsulimonas corticalis TaxID=2219043 RepID=A0A402D1X7_9BACT|nr:DUF92 domain-containing protein [Capsulimonas corticalis]BDI30060.1 hypothetical protein CCAX7_21110 [Capsulimonas corticalis]